MILAVTYTLDLPEFCVESSKTLGYQLGDEAEAWRFNDDNSMDLRAALAP